MKCPDDLKPFRVLKARKAKHGFQVTVALEHLRAMADAKQFIDAEQALVDDAEVLDAIQRPTFIELIMNMGTNRFTVYTQDDAVAEKFLVKFCK